MAKTNQEDKKYTILGGLICAIIAVIVMFIVNNNKPAEEITNSEPTYNKAGGYTLTEEEVANYCQDPNLIAKYLNLQKVDIIASPFKADQPNLHYVTEAFGYDKDGNTLVYYTWKGWDKTAEEAITFSCYVSGPNKDSITLHNLRASEYYSNEDVYLYGSEKFDHYDENGELIPME